jgi:hypothetical protein
MNPVQRQKVSIGFTAVPHDILRSFGQFEDPLDFMIYLHFFTFSHGYGRDTASMGVLQLEKYTGAGRNRVKRSLDRLIDGGWIKLSEEFEHARVCRKWRVKTTGAKLDSVQNEQSSKQSARGSKMNPVTGFKTDPFLENTHKENFKETLSLSNQALQKYFSQTMPPRKRESELRALKELQEEYSQDQVGMCVEYLAARGVPGSGEPCHSPMVFLSKAITRVLSEANAEHEKRERIEAQKRAETERVAMATREEQESALAFAEQEAAFIRAFPNEADQAEKVAEFAQKFPWLAKDGVIARRLAIGEWQRNQNGPTKGNGLKDLFQKR